MKKGRGCMYDGRDVSLFCLGLSGFTDPEMEITDV